MSRSLLAATIVLAAFALPAPADEAVPAMLTADSFEDVLRQVAMTAPIPEDDIELHGRLALVWKADEHMVFELQGDTVLVFQQKRLTAQRVVAWIRTYRKDRVKYHDLLLYAEGDVKLTNGGGTVSENGNMLVTLTGSGDVLLVSDRKITGPPAEQDELFARAATARQRLLAGEAAPLATPLPAAEAGPVTPGTQPATGPTQPATGPAGEPAAAPAAGRPLLVSGSDFKSTVTGGVRVTTIVGSVRVQQTGSGEDNGGYLEISADNAVLWSTAEGDSPAPGSTTRFEGAYLEGNVQIRQGTMFVRAPRIYFDVAQDRFLILDGLLKFRGQEGAMPFYLRAEEIRQVSKTKFVAQNAIFTTDAFNPPHYDLSAQSIELSEVQIVDPERGMRGARMRFRANNVTAEVRQVPAAWMAMVAGEVTTEPQPLKTVTIGYDNKYGPMIQSKWFLWRLLGIEGPKGNRTELRLDYLGSRGPAIGYSSEYEAENFAGFGQGYLIDDSDPERDEADQGLRGRFLIRHKHILPRDWSLTLEISYLSDRNFLREFDERDEKEGKEQETLLYGKKQMDNWAMTVQLQGRICDWLQTVERYPEVGFRWIGQPIGPDLVLYSATRFGWLKYEGDDTRRDTLAERLATQDAAIATLESGGPLDEAGATTLANLQLARQNTLLAMTTDPPDTSTLARFDTREEVQWPFKLGIWRITPWASLRYTAQQDGPEVMRAHGVPFAGTVADDGTATPTFETTETGGSRVYGTVGIKMRTDIQRVYDGVTSKLLDLHRMRHVISPEFTAFAAWSNKEYDELYGFDDDVDRNLDAFGAVDMRVRQRWQTMRGGPGRWTSVDWFTLVVGTTLYWRNELDPQFLRGRFFDSEPEFSQARDNIYLEAAWRLSETTSILADCQFDLEDSALSFANIGVAISRSPRLSHYIGARYIRAIGSTVITYTSDYRLNYKYRVRLMLQYDTTQQKFLQSQVLLTRRMPGWIVEVGVGYDQVDDDLNAQLVLYPVGAGNVRIGSFQ